MKHGITLLSAVLLLGVGVARGDGDAEALHGQALKLLHEKGFAAIDEAAGLFRKAAAADPSFTAAHQGVADALILKYELSAPDVRQQDWLTAALRSLETVVQQRPASAKGHFSCASAYFDLGESEKGMASLEKAYLIDPGNLKIAVAIMDRFLETGRTAEALAVALDRDGHFARNGDAQKTMGDVLLRRGRPQDAVGHYRYALSLKPDHPTLTAALGEALMAAGDYPQAARQFEAALKLAPGEPAIRFKLAYCRAALGDHQEAIDDLKAYLAAAPNDVGAMNNLALNLEKLGRDEEARNVWEQIRKHPAVSESHRKRAELRLTSPAQAP